MKNTPMTAGTVGSVKWSVRLTASESSSPISSGNIGTQDSHVCFEVDDIDAATRDLEQKGFRVVSEQVDCVSYDRSFDLGKDSSTRIAFSMTSNMLLIELLQKGK